MRRKIPAPLIALLIGAAVSLWALNNSAPDRMPGLSFTSIRGVRLSPADFTGRPVLVTFWSTTCDICRREMPQLADLYRTLHRQGLQIIAIAMPYDPPNRVVEVSAAERFPYPVVLDLKSRIARSFGRIDATPTTFLVAPDGSVVFRQEGMLNIEALKVLLHGMLPESRDRRVTPRRGNESRPRQA